MESMMRNLLIKRSDAMLEIKKRNINQSSHCFIDIASWSKYQANVNVSSNVF